MDLKQSFLNNAKSVLISMVALLSQWFMDAKVDGGLPLFLFSYPAVFFISFFGGRGPGLVSTIITGLGAWYLFLPPYQSFSLAGPREVISLIVFVDLAMAFAILVPISNERRLQTKLKPTKNALLTKEEKMRFALESIHAGEWELDLKSDTVQRSPLHDQIFGYGRYQNGTVKYFRTTWCSMIVLLSKRKFFSSILRSRCLTDFNL